MTDTASTPKITLGFAISGSFCTYQKILTVLDSLREMPWDIIPIFSEKSATLDTRFQTATSFVNQVESSPDTKVSLLYRKQNRSVQKDIWML